jgi:hypothetical protein
LIERQNSISTSEAGRAAEAGAFCASTAVSGATGAGLR